jgi:hypothetical protein
MALFFAVESYQPPSPVVWLFDATWDHAMDARQLDDELGIQDHDKTLLIQPAPHSHRVVAQAGWHTVHSLGRHNGRGIRAMNDDEDAARLTCIAIDSDMWKFIKDELRSMGIHAATVYGDLNSVCREIENDTAFPLCLRGTAKPPIVE